MPSKTDKIRTVEWHMLDKWRFYPLSILSTFLSRCVIYPNMLIRTRLQMQHQNDLYRGAFDAYRKILRDEGVRGLYKGFWISTFQIVPGVTYVTTYEGVRQLLENTGVKNTEVRALIGGASAAAVGQTIIVPFDVITQHLMLVGKTKKQVGMDVIRTIYRRDGFRGFFRGYTTSLSTSVPSSSSWWTFYHIYQDTYSSILPSCLPYTMVQAIAGVASGCTTSMLTNPLDLLRVRVQVQRRSVLDTVIDLWRTERWSIFTKGLTARMTSMSIISLVIIFGYETVKKITVYEEYQDKILW